MDAKKKSDALLLYLILTGLFVCSLVTCNLIFLKFFEWKIPLFNGEHYSFIQSVGLLAYPFTFIITDIISEVFGAKSANRVVVVGFFASMFMLLIVWIAIFVPEFGDSPVNQTTFKKVFGLSFLGVFASMTAYLVAQYVDIRIFHFWKRITNGKHLWLRNNASTMLSQVVDTFLVVFLLFYFNQIEDFWLIFINGVIFKIIFALVDTPIIYLILYGIRKYFNLKFAEEIKL